MKINETRIFYNYKALKVKIIETQIFYNYKVFKGKNQQTSAKVESTGLALGLRHSF